MRQPTNLRSFSRVAYSERLPHCRWLQRKQSFQLCSQRVFVERAVILHATNLIVNMFLANLQSSIGYLILSVCHSKTQNPYSASLTGISDTAKNEIHSARQGKANIIEPLSEKDALFASHDSPNHEQKPAPAMAPRARTSWLPPLSFQLSSKAAPLESLPVSICSVTTPNRPLLRSQSTSTSTSTTQSSFYSRFTAESSFYLHPGAVSSMTLGEDRAMCDSPLDTAPAIRGPEVPPIPERWRTASRESRPAPRPGNIRYGSPHADYWQYGTSPNTSTSWATTTTPTISDKRDPSICRYPIFNTSPNTASHLGSTVRGSKSDTSKGQRSYEGLRKGEGSRPFPSGSAPAKWLELDDREDHKTKQKRRSRTLVKQRQP